MFIDLRNVFWLTAVDMYKVDRAERCPRVPRTYIHACTHISGLEMNRGENGMTRFRLKTSQNEHSLFESFENKNS